MRLVLNRLHFLLGSSSKSSFWILPLAKISATYLERLTSKEWVRLTHVHPVAKKGEIVRQIAEGAATHNSNAVIRNPLRIENSILLSTGSCHDNIDSYRVCFTCLAFMFLYVALHIEQCNCIHWPWWHLVSLERDQQCERLGRKTSFCTKPLRKFWCPFSRKSR